jgi:methionyl-tRNA synthetase
MKLADEANTFFNDNAPWKLDKDKDKKIIQEISTQAINYYKIIITLLSPILPNLFDESCKILNIKKLNIKNYKDPTLDHEINKFSPLKNRIDEEDVKEFVN